MPRYFIEVLYKGTRYAGFQIQQNANTIQAEIEKALKIYYKQAFTLTGSSRTDAGVHALQNYFHFDTDLILDDRSYHLNAILPSDIVVKKIFKVNDNLHCRFDAMSREYVYQIYQSKNPFLDDSAYFYPIPLCIELLQQAANELIKYNDFTSFSKKNTQAKSAICNITKSEWSQSGQILSYNVQSNRFLRGMVRGLVGTMLKVGKKTISIHQFEEILKAKDCSKADFSTPPQGLFLKKVSFNKLY